MRTPQRPTAQTLGQRVGHNVRDARDAQGLTQPELLERCLVHGLKWPRSRLVELEQGRVADVTLSELIVFGSALGLTVSQLLQGEGTVELPAGGVTASTADVIGWLAGRSAVTTSATTARGHSHEPDDAGASMPVHPFERELARRFNVPIRQIQYSASNLFGRPLETERDARVNAEFGELSKEERTARRGHVARSLAREIEADLKRRWEI